MATAQHSQPDPVCPLCDGTGWKSIAIAGKANRVTRCDCHMAARALRLLAQAEIPRQYEHCTLADFDVTFRSATESLKRALMTAKRFVDQYPLEKEGMLLWGDCGTGKTHLAIAILKELIQQKGTRCLFRGYSALLKQLQATYSRQMVAHEETGVVLTEYSILRDVTDVEVLVLDKVNKRDYPLDDRVLNPGEDVSGLLTSYSERVLALAKNATESAP